MSHYTSEELTEAVRSITSTIGKCEKALPKLKEGTAQHTMTVQAIKAYYTAVELIRREMGAKGAEASLQTSFSGEDLTEALQAIASANSRCEGILPKLKPGSSQHTLTVRRIKAFSITTELIRRELQPPAQA